MKRKLLACWLVLCCAVLGQRVMAQTDWTPSFEAIQSDVEYYLYNVGTKTYLNDDNSLTAAPKSLWTVNGNEIKSDAGKYISVTSGSALSGYRASASANASSAATSAIENKETFYQIGNKVTTGAFGASQTRFILANGSTLGASTTNNVDGNNNAHWLFVSKTAYIDGHPRFEVSVESINLGNVTVNTSVSQTFTFSHASTEGPVTITVGGTNATNFTVSPSSISECGKGKEGQEEITVTYAPTQAGTNGTTHTASLTITDGVNTINVALQGTAKRALNLDNLKKAITYAEDIFAKANANLGFDRGEYAPYAGIKYLEEYNLALDMVANPANYTQTEVNTLVGNLGATSLTNWTNDEWKANTSEVNAVAPGTVITSVYGTEPNYTMPLHENQNYKLTFNYTGAGTVTILDGNGSVVGKVVAPAAEASNLTYYFKTGAAGNYVIRVDGVELTNADLRKTDDKTSIFKPATLEDGKSYYLVNKMTGLYMGSANTLQDYDPVLFTAVADGNGGYALKNPDGQYINITITPDDGTLGTGGSATPTAVTATPNGALTNLAVTEADGGYMLSSTATWQYGGIAGIGRQQATYTAYLTAVPGNAAITLGTTNNAADAYNVWVLVTEDDYNSSPAVKNAAVARLRAAVEAARAALNMDAPLVTAKGSVTALLVTADAQLLAPGIYSATVLNATAAGLEAAVENLKAMSDTYVACNAEIDNIRAMGGMDVACGVADAALEAAINVAAMNTAMDVLAAAVFARLALLNDNTVLPDNTNLNGMIRNNSFDTGTMRNWYTFKVDAGAAAGAIGDIISGAINGGGNFGSLAGLANIISISDFDENSYPVVNGGTMINGHNKYYYQTRNAGLLGNLTPTGQMIFTPLIGLPAGDYRAKALMSGNFGGFLGIGNSNCHLTAVVIPANTGILGNILGSIDITDPTNIGNLMGGIMGSIGDIISQGSIVSGNGSARNANEFTEVSVDFELEEGAVVLLFLNAGLIPLTGNSPFKADNVRLEYLQSPKSAKQQMASALNAADVPDANQATRASNDNPFTYNTNLVNQYQKAVDAANAVATSGTKSTKEIADAAKKLADFQATFFDKAFQGPTASGLFNINMLDENAASCVGKSATFGETNITFTELAGQTNYLQTVSFEKTGDAVNTYYLTATLADGSKAYLTGNGALSTTTDQSKATVYSVVPSTHVESANAIKSGNTAIGVATNSNVLSSASTVSHNALSVTPAKKHDVVLNVSSVGWSTFMLPYDGVLPKGFVAYRATGVEDNLVVDIDEVEELEACVPYLVRHTDDEGNLTAGTYTFSDYARATSKMHTDGLLTGAFERTPIEANADNYVLQNNNNRLGFYAVDSEGIFVGANRAYLTDKTHGQLVKAMSGIFSDEATAIEGIHKLDGNAEVYDLSGRRIQKPTHGIYIVNGKKVLK